MKGIFFFLVILISTATVAQDLDFETFSIENGLPRSGVYSMIQDNHGFIWIGTEGGGVCIYDGQKFRAITEEKGLIDNNVRRVFQDSKGDYWFGTPKGVSYLHDGEFINFTKENGLEDDFVRFIEEDGDRNVWISTNQGVSVFNLDRLKIEKKSKFNFSLPHRKVRSLLFDGESMWFGTDAGLCRLKDDKLSIITTLNGLTHDRVLCLEHSDDGKLYVGTNKGLNILEDGKVIKSYTKEDGLLNDRIRAITNTNGIGLFVGTREGLGILNPKTDVLVTLTEENGLSNNRIRTIITDDHNNVWIGTYFGGIMKYTPGDFFSVTKENGIISDQILHITEDDKGHIIIGTTEGVSKLKYKNRLINEVVNVKEEDGLIYQEVKYVYRDKHQMYWYGTSSGISVFKKNQHFKNIEIEDGLVDADVNVIKEINPNEIWVGTSDGITILNISNREELHYEPESFSFSNGLSGIKVTFIEKDKEGNVWVGFENGTFNVFRQGRIIKPEQGDGLSSINTGIIDSKNNIWIGTEGKGLVKVEYNSEEKKIVSRKYTIAHGLISNFIYSITESNSGNLWVGTEKGVSKIVFLKDGSIDYVRSYDSDDGFFGLENNANSILCDKSGNLWFGTVRGVMYLLRHNEDGNKKEADLHITRIESNGSNYDWFDHEGETGLFELPENFEIPYHDNYLEIHFTGLFLSNPNDVEYSWKFKESDNWSLFSKKDYVHFTNLNPGEYTIQVRTRTPENIITKEPLEFTFVVIEPFYMNIWFRIFIGFCIVGLGYLIYRWRVRKLKQQKEELEQIVENRTQEISSQNEQLSIKNTEITDSINYAKRIQDTIIPSEERIKSLLGPESFVLFKPKDIVSGDFYWIREVDEFTKIFCVADCTGHGVPGAMVSLVGANALHKAVGEFNIYKPSEILDKVNILLNEAFSNEGKSVADGMDIAICKITKKEGKTLLEYSGGNNALWVFNPKRTAMPENSIAILNADKDAVGFTIKPNKFGVGKFYENESFTNHELELFNDDEIIIFTDGYADQFGGKSLSQKPLGKKFKYSRLKQLLAEVHHEHLDYQKDLLDKTIEDWKGDLEQVDDICMMGVKI